MPSWSFVHGIVLGLPLVVLAALCISDTSRVGKAHPWLRSKEGFVRRWAWLGLLIFAWLTPLSGMLVMYVPPTHWMTERETWQSLALPWMASWGMMVPIIITTCIYMARRARHRTITPKWFRRALWGLMGLALGDILLTALLGSLTTQGLFYR